MATPDQPPKDPSGPRTEQAVRYTIERLLAEGPIAEVFLGRAEGPDGAKSVVIQRILPELAQDPAFAKMFMAEARLALLLKHPNIVQAFDFGQRDGSCFIATEYVDGESLRTLHQHFAAEKRLLPQLHVAEILIGVCEGLHYAHKAADATGVPCNIVHGDLSPENILVSTTGIPKVVNFGVAKTASLTAGRTAAGTLKGKYSYMSPEQIRGEVLDRRSDVYTLGVTLFELLTGTCPFVSESDQDRRRLVLEGPVPEASQVNPKVGPRLSQIISTAMARDRKARYQDAQGLQIALEQLLASVSKRVTTAQLAKLVGGVSPSGKATAVDRSGTLQGPATMPEFPLAGVEGAPGLLSSTVGRQAADGEASSLRGRRRQSTLATAVGLGGVALVATVWLVAQSRATSQPGSSGPIVAVTPAPTGPLATAAPLDPVPAIATPRMTPRERRAVAAGPHEVAPRDGSDLKPTASLAHGSLVVQVTPWAQVFLDGRSLGTTPIQPQQVVEGPHEVRLVNPELRRDETRPVVIHAGAQETVKASWN